MNLKKTCRVYALAAAGTALFSAVYEHFSHGVYSPWMIFAFLIPLVGGLGLFALLGRAPWRYRPGAGSASLCHSALATLTLGSLFAGVMEIYGTTSRYTLVYGIAGFALLLTALLAYGIERIRYRRVYGV